MAELLIDRRNQRVDRRRRTLAAYLYGALKPRRVSGRRATDRLYPVIDWHSPRVLALAFAILALSTLDGIFTIFLIAHGAIELNPLMAMLVPHNLPWFAAAKLGLTGSCLAVLVACSKMRVLRAIPGEIFLYAVLGCYVVLIVHELEMLQQLAV